MPLTFDDLTTYDNRRLEPLMASGAIPSAPELVGDEFRGWNIQPLTDVLGTRKFIKGFYGDRRAHLLGIQHARRAERTGQALAAEASRTTSRSATTSSRCSPVPTSRTRSISGRWPSTTGSGRGTRSSTPSGTWSITWSTPIQPIMTSCSGRATGQLKDFIWPFLGFFILVCLRPSAYTGPPTR